MADLVESARLFNLARVCRPWWTSGSSYKLSLLDSQIESAASDSIQLVVRMPFGVGHMWMPFGVGHMWKHFGVGYMWKFCFCVIWWTGTGKPLGYWWLSRFCGRLENGCLEDTCVVA